VRKVNFQVLFGIQGLSLTTAEVEKTKISKKSALQVAAAKWINLSSIIYS
jgi:hypothetical protein